MRRVDDFSACGEVRSMAGDGEAGDDFVRRASALFAAELFKPMFQRATAAPEDVRALIAEFRGKLDALDTVIAACPTSTEPTALGWHRPAPSAGGSAGATRTSHLSADIDGEQRDGLDEVGRNQRSRLRELVMLEALAREARPFALQQVVAALDQRGFTDTSGAIVSQLHRLKKLGIIDQPANGMYEITDEGLGHLRRLRSSFGALLNGS